MSQATPSAGASRPTPDGRGRHDAWAEGGRTFAGVLLLVNGALGIVQGVAGIAEDDVYGRVGDYVFEFSAGAWGWIHLALGVFLAAVGWGILTGSAVARAVGVALAGISVVLNFLWLPYVPVWAIVSIAIGVFVIWALCTDGTRSAAGPPRM